MLRRPGSAGGGGGAWKAVAAFAAGALVITVMNSLPGQNAPTPSSQPAASAPVSLRALSPQGSQLTAEHLSGIFVAPSASPRDVDSYGRGAASPRVVDSYARGAAPLAASAHLPEADPARQASVPASPPARDPLCGRGIFLDLGAHDGSSIPEFLTPAEMKSFFIYAWEPNPKHVPSLAALHSTYPHFVHFPKAVWNAEGEDVTLYIDKSNDNMKGSGIIKKSYGNKHSDSATVNVKTTDIHAWIMANTCEEDDIVVKMDIEGAEYEVLRQMILMGSACRMRKLYIEFHARLDPLSRQSSNRIETAFQQMVRYLLRGCPRPVPVQIVE